MLKHLALAGAAALLVATTAHAQSTDPAAAAAAPTTHASATPAKHDTPAAKPTKDQITMVQQALAKDGLYKGKVDGEWNNALGDALKKYQTQNKLKVTGKLDEETLAKLKPAMPAAAPAQ